MEDRFIRVWYVLASIVQQDYNVSDGELAFLWKCAILKSVRRKQKIEYGKRELAAAG